MSVAVWFYSLPDYSLHQRGDEKGQPLRAGHDQHHLDQRDELRGVEQEGRAGDRTSHQTLEGAQGSEILRGPSVRREGLLRDRLERRSLNPSEVVFVLGTVGTGPSRNDYGEDLYTPDSQRLTNGTRPCGFTNSQAWRCFLHEPDH